jgi:hypothetical protein
MAPLPLILKAPFSDIFQSNVPALPLALTFPPPPPGFPPGSGLLLLLLLQAAKRIVVIATIVAAYINCFIFLKFNLFII